MPKDITNSIIEVSQAIIHFQGSYLMQLRDFKDDIESPGHWGFFAGHIETCETPEQTIWREIKEELCWQPKDFYFLGDLIYGNRKMYVYYCELNSDIKSLTLKEGEEVGVFELKQIKEKKLYSKKKKKVFPVTDISYRVFKKFSNDLG